MNHSLDKVRTPQGETRFEVRIWGRERLGDVKRRFKSRDEALKAIEVFYQEATHQRLSLGDPTFQEEFEFWLEHRGRTFSPGWRKNVDTYWRLFKERLSHLRVSELSKSLLREMESKLLESGNSQKTVNEKLGLIMSVLNYSVEMDRIKHHNLINFKKTKALQDPMVVWSRDESIRFLQAMRVRYRRTDTHWAYVAYLIALTTGMRASEIWGLDWSCVRFEERMIRVERQWDIASQTFRETKGKEHRMVPLTDELAAELRLFRIRSKRALGLVITYQNRPICHRAFQRRFARDIVRSASPKVNFHAMRHAAASMWLMSGVNVKVVQEMLGHKDLTTTQRYLTSLRLGVRDVAMTFDLPVNVKTVSD